MSDSPFSSFLSSAVSQLACYKCLAASLPSSSPSFPSNQVDLLLASASPFPISTSSNKLARLSASSEHGSPGSSAALHSTGA